VIAALALSFATGLGVVGPCGIGRDAFWQGLLGPAPEGDRVVHDFDPTVWLGPKEARRTDRFAQMAIGAAATQIVSMMLAGASSAMPMAWMLVIIVVATGVAYWVLVRR